MAKWFGKIGYSMTEEVRPGVWKDNIIVEKDYYGELLRSTSSRRENVSQQINPDIIITNSISILADPFANENFSHIKYAELMGTKWIVSGVEVQYPRLLLTLGGVYNG